MDQDSARSDIFISYAREDRDRVAPLVAALEKRRWTVFWDREIPIGQRFDTFIQERLDKTRCVIVLWSAHSVHSEWVSIEADEGKARGILVPARLDGVTPPLAFRRTQTADLSGWRGDAAHVEFDRMVRSVGSILTGTVEPVPEPAPPPSKPKVPEPLVSKKPVGAASPKPNGMAIALGAVVVFGLGVWKFYPGPAKPADAGQVAPLPATAPQPLVAGATYVNEKDGLTYRYIPPTSAEGFSMGCSPGDSECDSDEKPAHQVRITKGFWLGETEVTQAAYKKVMSGADPSHLKGDNLPVESVSWDEARDYCQKTGGRLPTEAEWEWAARAGSNSARYGDVDLIAWYNKNSNSKTHPVGLKPANAWRLRDMLGNVSEWVGDWYAPYGPGTVSDPRGPPSGSTRVVRGGGWVDGPRVVRASLRSINDPGDRGSNTGLRCAGEFR